MLLSILESNDWKSNDDDTCKERKNKSISAFYLTNDNNGWYNKITDLTFETEFLKLEDIGDKLPYNKCMVRWENKSPKDSEHWGPVTNKEEVQRLFHTSLRCKTNVGKIYCFREWIPIYNEFRCFWNGTLRAVSGDDKSELDDMMVNKILEYIGKIKDRIPYIRCVFDICRVKENDTLVFKIIEFNSWETNSGAHFFDWYDDTSIFYEDENIHFKSKNYSCIRPYIQPFVNSINTKSIEGCNFTVMEPTNDDNYLIFNNHIYICNDIWLGKFTMNLEPLRWVRGNFRFTKLSVLKGKIAAAGKLYSDMRIVGTHADTDSRIKHRYGCRITMNGVEVIVHMDSNCNLVYL